ncbi:MAG: guanylate kinase [Candidatus Magasanikbacteria bacterium]|jgi:guanylate kinase|nr:guanylate kinase [Candidatus Magasanikbacteria bacterium]MBT4314850.1 guanylate kinase [Candidatus Magasanikbacteria bacterium]MBT4546763.1 guanylate kinase [Candidatus Magasanikbacteria bacterium]MBT6819628.1 guanylate kinase [Candidatus Magasanikbacteria bacterium]
MNKGLLVVISSTSGGGKDSVIRELIKIFPNSARLVTTTSRPPRPGNKEGIDYYFISREEFENRLSSDGFVEHNEYAGNLYGIEKSRLEESLTNNEIVFTQIEVNGKHNLDKVGLEHLSIFLIPDDFDNLAERIRGRGGVSEEKLKERLEIAKYEVEKSEDYDYKVVNIQGKFEETVDKVANIIRSHSTIDKKSQI